MYFFKFVKANEVIKVGEIRRFPGFSPLQREQKEVKIDFYRSELTDVEFVTEKAPGPGLVLQTQDAWKTRNIEINLFFRGTEIKVTAVNPTSKTQVTAHLDFLSTSHGDA